MPAAPSPALDSGSPIANDALERAARRIAAAWRVVQKRAPRDVNRRVRACLERVYRVANAPGGNVRERVALARLLEQIDAELHARSAFDATFYREGRLGVIRAWDPIRIRGAVDHVAIEERFDRYVSRAERAIERLNYFLERAGVEREQEQDIKPWDRPYASMDEYRELLWGRISRANL